MMKNHLAIVNHPIFKFVSYKAEGKGQIPVKHYNLGQQDILIHWL